jgi:hypothetical protein
MPVSLVIIFLIANDNRLVFTFASSKHFMISEAIHWEERE